MSANSFLSFKKVLRLLTVKKEQEEEEITRLKILLMERNTEVEKLKDLCLKQREEIKSLQSTILFPDYSMSSQLISSLQRQLGSLEGRLQSLAHDVTELKAEKYFGRGHSDNHFSYPITTLYDRDYAAKPQINQEYRTSHYTTPSPDKMILRDFKTHGQHIVMPRQNKIQGII